MSELNKDGLIPDQQVDFETIQRIERKRQEQQHGTATEENGATNQQGIPIKPPAARKAKTQKSG